MYTYACPSAEFYIYINYFENTVIEAAIYYAHYIHILSSLWSKLVTKKLKSSLCGSNFFFFFCYSKQSVVFLIDQFISAL